jgi:hypothetical protein
MIKGVIEGALGAVCFLYALQTHIMYPEYALNSIDHPWIILIAFASMLLIWRWSPVASLLGILCIFAFVADLYIFTHKNMNISGSGSISVGGSSNDNSDSSASDDENDYMLL